MTKVRKNILLISIFFCAVLLPKYFFSQVNLTAYPPSLDGLQSANCFDIVQDRKGVLWIATEEGISKFDGTDFSSLKQNDGLSNDNIYDLELFNGDYVLASGRGGVDLINIHTDSIRNIFPTNNFGEVGQICYDITTNNIHIFSKPFWDLRNGFENNDRAHKVIDGSNFSLKKTDIMVCDIFQLDSITFNKTVDIKGKENYYYILKSDTIFLDHDSIQISKFFKFKNGIYASTTDGIKLIRGDSLVDYALLGQKIDFSYVINNDFYFTSNSKLYEFNGSHITYLMNVKDYGSELQSLFLDRENNVWIGCGNGLLKIKNAPFNNYDKKSGLVGNPLEISRDKNTKLWVSTSKGIFCKEDSSKNFYQVSNKMTYAFEFTKNEKLFFHSWSKGLYTINMNSYEENEITLKSKWLSNKILKRVNLFLKNGIVRDITKDKLGNFWILAGGPKQQGMVLQLDQDLNLIRFFDSNIRAGSYPIFDNVDSKRTLGGWLPCIYVDSQNRKWFRSNFGISMIDGHNYKFYYEKDFMPQIPGGIYMIREDSYGNLVLATEQGLYKIMLRNNDIIRILKFTSNEGLTSKKIFSLEFTKMGHLIAGASNGLNKIFHFDTVSVQQDLIVTPYSLKEGLVTSDHISNSSFIDDDHSIWLGQSFNLLHYLPEKDFPNEVPPLLSLDEIKLNNESQSRWNIKSGEVGELKHVDEPLFYYDQNDLTFIVKSVTYDGPGSSTYDYFLEGFNSNWEESIEYPYIRYNNLSPGKYTFKARSSNKDGFKSEEIQYHFIIEEPFFQKTWFILIIIFGSIAFISGLFILRQRQLKADNIILEKKVVVRTQQLQEEKQNVEKKNNQILQSINYAKRIQSSILPDHDVLNHFFSNHFVFYQPKDVVGGDFYWFRSFGDVAVMATVDCTGHGVPGGFMSMMGSLLLDKIVQENNLDTAKILDQLNKEIIRVLKQDQENAMQDGMDLSICVINKKDKALSFSGARNGIFVLNGNDKKYYDADLFPVGGFYSKKSKEMERNYHSTKIKLKPDSWVFMYTDGYYDQLGGDRMLSLGMDLFMGHLSKAVKSSDDNVVTLKEEYDNWRGQLPPIDDVLVIGFQI